MLVKICLFFVISVAGNALASTKSVQFYDRNNDQYNEERETRFVVGYHTLKIIREIDSNKNQKYDKKITIYFHHDRNKAYSITKFDLNHDGKWDKKDVKITPIGPIF